MSTRICPTCLTPRPVNKDGNTRRHLCVKVDGDTFALPWATPPLTANQVRRLHPMREAALRRDALNEARWAIRAARLAPRVVAEVVLHWRMPDNRRRDGDGAGPTLKVVLDALVHEGVLPDDSWAHVRHSGVTVWPPQPKMPGSLWVEIREPAVEQEEAS
jgi:hypothetical protein